ncbi:putative heterotrimeric G-protein GTPase [Kockovaella imperatae]|uniref:Putative heterotrimeric G-protein GTPase n=1 Tax=Kockovaella imperatae TaxID=4999 RepID=A0A1Y1UMB0_9TREE|nr:putative heterotrimeric G-protein GTPase [Kockovaella imperatae]ORX38624.1 putative heterotrimeric G-protein GTPase [Kockovaella imperatae]
MGACTSSPSNADPAADARSREIDRALREDEKKLAKEVKLLILGAGASGKSTVLKQMRYIHNQPFSPAEIEDYRKIVFTNVVGGMRAIIDTMDELSMAISPANRKYVSFVDQEPAINTGEPFPARYLEALRALWSDEQVQACYARAHEFALQENIPYFYAEGKLEKLFEPDYKPSDDDVLRVRAKTTGISETWFNLKDIRMRVLDVGGQRSERRKWASCFEDVTAIIFIFSLADYNAGIIEDTSSNGMMEALILWESIVNSQWFTKTNIILFANKWDLLASKIIKKDQQILPYFPDFPGKPGSANDAFRSLNRNPNREVYIHTTTAVDQENIRVILAATQDTIVKNMLQSMALI